MLEGPISIAIHGGAGTILRSAMTPEKEAAYTEALRTAIDLGHRVLLEGGSAVEAVEGAVIKMEDSHLFNAGKGSVFTSNGTHEMDAAIMDGATLNAGAASLVQGVRNPITLARTIMDHSPSVILAGEGACEFAVKMKLKFEDELYFYDQFRFEQWQELKGTESIQLDHAVRKDEKFGTVGAVALDQDGNIAAATSTGGMTNKRFGRIGDTPIIGAGNYANNATCAVSCTGSGEFFIRSVTAYDVSCLMEYAGLPLREATEKVVHEHLPKIGGDGGLIAVDTKGSIAMPFNTDGMYRACRRNREPLVIGIYGG